VGLELSGREGWSDPRRLVGPKQVGSRQCSSSSERLVMQVPVKIPAVVLGYRGIRWQSRLSRPLGRAQAVLG